MVTKRYKLSAEEIRPLVVGYGAAIASDMITVEGRRVGFMYRETPDNQVDSGWRFFSGSESEAYSDNPSNFAYYDLNTIANYDPEIIPFLDFPVGTSFERTHEGGPLLRVESEPSK